MCGRYNLNSTPAQIGKQFGLRTLFDLAPRANVAPTQTVPGVVATLLAGGAAGAGTERELRWFRWGLVPSWSREAKPAGIINARAETVAAKPAFRAAFRQRRCILPADGFYEWQKAGQEGGRAGRKIPFHIHLRSGQMLGLAGLWEPWQAPDGQSVPTCTILTTDANDLVRPIHDRMPVILSPEDYATWLDPALDAPARLQELLRPYPAAEMAADPVEPAINNPRPPETLWDAKDR